MKSNNTINITIFFLIFSIFQTISAQNERFDSLANEVNRVSRYKKTKALEMLDSLYQMAFSSNDNSVLIAICLYEEASLNYYQGIVDTLMKNKINERLEKETLSLKEYAVLQSALGLYLVNNGEYGDAFSVQLQALEKFKNLNLNLFIARTLNNMGNICYSINLFNMAENYYIEALKYISSENHEYWSIKSSIFTRIRHENYEDYIDSMLHLIELAEKENLEDKIPLLYQNIGAYLINSLPDLASFYFNKMLELDFENTMWSTHLCGNIGIYYLMNKDYQKALENFKNVQKITKRDNASDDLAYAYYYLSHTFEEMNLIDSALFYARKYEDLIQKLHSNTIAVETHQKYITTILESTQKDLLIKEQENELKNRQFTIVSIIAVSVILLILLLLILFQLQKRHKIRELNSKIKLKEVEKAKQEELSNAKSRELTSYSALVSNKNLILSQIMELNSQEYNKEVKTKISEIIRNNLNIDEEWTNFKLHFDSVHPNFFEKLKQMSSDLTEENLKICAYIKMGMTSKQIAQLMNVVKGSVDKSLQRLKKKLQLSEEESLKSFICSVKY